MQNRVRPRVRGRGERSLLWVAIAFVLVLFGAAWLVRSAVDRPHQAANSSICVNNLKQIELALHNYRDDQGTFPPAATYGPDGKAWHSWRVLILPYLDRADLYRAYRLDEPWDGPNNRRLADSEGVPDMFRCPSDRDTAAGATSYLAVVGTRTMWPPGGVAVDAVADDPATTLHVAEVSGSGVTWTEPRDLPLEHMTFRVNDESGTGPRSRHTERANAAFVDGHVGKLQSDTAPETLKSLLLRDDGGPKPEEWP